MLITLIRTIILYIIVLVVMRLMGKREIGQLQPFELAISFSGNSNVRYRNTNYKWYYSNFRTISYAFTYFIN